MDIVTSLLFLVLNIITLAVLAIYAFRIGTYWYYSIKIIFVLLFKKNALKKCYGDMGSPSYEILDSLPLLFLCVFVPFSGMSNFLGIGTIFLLTMFVLIDVFTTIGVFILYDCISKFIKGSDR